MVGPLSVDLHTRGDLHMEIVGGGRGGGRLFWLRFIGLGMEQSVRIGPGFHFHFELE